MSDNVVQLPHESGTALSPIATVDVIDRLIQTPDLDPQKLVTLLDVQERLFDKQAQLAFNTAKREVTSKLTPIIKASRNNHTNSNYADLAAIAVQADPIISDAGFSLTFGEAECPKADHKRIICDVFHEAGHERQYYVDIALDGAGFKGAANKTPTHACGSTLSYGRRYLKCMIFDIALADDDGNAASMRTNAPEPPAPEPSKPDPDAYAKADKYAKGFASRLDEFETLPCLIDYLAEHEDNLAWLKTRAPDLHTDVQRVIDARKSALAIHDEIPV